MPFFVLALFLGQDVSTFTGPANVPARNELERLVLGPLDDREKVADWIEAHAEDAAGLQKAMDEIGFERIRDNNNCRNYVYSRLVGAKGVTRIASITWCGKRPFVLLSSTLPDALSGVGRTRSTSLAPGVPK